MSDFLKELDAITKELNEFNEQVKVMNATIQKAIQENKLSVKDKNGTIYILSTFEEYESAFDTGVMIFGLKELFPNCECQDF